MIEARLAASAKMLGWERSAPREGSALLQGVAVCGLCGSRMHIHYNVRRNGERIPNYVCYGRSRLFSAPSCQSMLVPRSMPRSANCWSRPSPPWPSSSRSPSRTNSLLASTKPIGFATNTSSAPSTRRITRDSGMHGSTPPTDSSPTPWRQSGTPGCAPWRRRNRSTSGNAPPTPSWSTSRNANAFSTSPPTSLPYGPTLTRRTQSANGCSRSSSRMSR
ncbi:MAG: recombinase zinc beta ribbon domain-containing protein [Planctomycetes bacterium]|nr:recombinase zinc beta ribbon domain-containing protein [Planctomycetota bacterium]